MVKKLDAIKIYEIAESGNTCVWKSEIFTYRPLILTDEDHILDSLSQKLRTDVAFNVHINTLRKVQLFDRCDPALLRELVLKLRSVLFLPGDLICKRVSLSKKFF